MSLLPWSLSCIFIFWFWRCSSGTSLAACELSALPPSLLRHPKPWPRIKAFTTAFSLQDWYGALPSVPAETQSRFSFSLALLSPVYLALSRRTGRSFGCKQFPVPLPWPWCYFHEGAKPTSIHRRCRCARRCGMAAASHRGARREDKTYSPWHRRRAAAAEGQFGAGAGHCLERRGVRDRLWQRHRPPARFRRRAADQAAARLHHAPPFGPQRRLRQSDLAGVDRRAADTGRCVGASAPRENDQAVLRDERV